MCGGHIVNGAFPNSCRKRVLERGDVDSFYGSVVESHFITVINSGDASIEEILTSKSLRKNLPWSIKVDGETIDSYTPGAEVPTNHSVVGFDLGGEKPLRLALKITEDELEAAKNVQFVLDRDYVPEAVASLLKAAHLTMFRVFGYGYVFSTAGLDVARILREFFERHKNTFKGMLSAEKQCAVADTFQAHMGMILPMKSFDQNLLKGTIEDNRFILCAGSSGRPFAIGVLVRTDDHMHVVFLPPSTADSVDTYMGFIANPNKGEFRYQIARYCAPSGGTEAFVEADPSDNLFKPA